MLFFSTILIFMFNAINAKFLEKQIVTRLSKKQHSVGEIPFPAVTICPDPVIPTDFFEASQGNISDFE